MKKKTLLTLGAAAAFAISCSHTSEQEIAQSSASSTIGFFTNTTRATVATITTLQDDREGFAVYGSKATDNDEWDTEMEGNNNYVYSDGLWAWSDSSPAWPTDSDAYPIEFYAFYSTSDEGVTLTDDTPSTIAVNYAAPTTTQSDLLVATASASARPSGDKLPLTFNHILSKCSFSITAGSGVTIHTQAVGFKQICDEREYDIAASDWKSQDADALDDYSFLDTVNPAVDSSKGSISGTRGDLMILPQTTDAWSPESGTEASGSHIYVTYRAQTTADVNLIGYADAASHPDYDAVLDIAYAGTPLFVAVGYGAGSPSFEVEKGKSYTYDINLGTEGATNGYLLSEYYFDENGNETSFEIKGKDVGDPVSDGYINFTVAVEIWDEQTASEIE